ncbi:hypothetical protein [Lysobacter arvi]|uniref:Uncharacterized protein n=1 Tax=Lysobacter arvi TaxID=3038776 RepID=A0ABU1CD33_9GAMM|nr:hypothetical protein [Lysobacter arvi]MDR0181957.1 hypothetical protein [Lysobacter arvi]
MSLVASLVLHNPLELLPLTSAVAAFCTGLAALAMLGGLMTPWFALAYCVGVIGRLQDADLGPATLMLVSSGFGSVALMLLGPGGYSLDALLFGQRIVRIPE